MAIRSWDSAGDGGDSQGAVSVEEGFLREALGMSHEQAQVGGLVLLVLRMVDALIELLVCYSTLLLCSTLHYGCASYSTTLEVY